MKKIICLFVTIIGVFGFLSPVNAEESWSSIGSGSDFVGDWIIGEDLSSSQTLKDILEKYDIYYKYVKIEDSVYKNYLSDTLGDTNTGAKQTVMALVPTVSSTSDLSSWVKVSDSNLAFADLDYDSTKDTGYVVGIAAVNKEDTSKIYVYRGVYEVSSASTLVDAYEKHYAEYQNNTSSSDNTTTTTTTQTVATTSNPNTGISDYVYVLVPIALVGGFVLMFRRKHV